MPGKAGDLQKQRVRAGRSSRGRQRGRTTPKPGRRPTPRGQSVRLLVSPSAAPPTSLPPHSCNGTAGSADMTACGHRWERYEIRSTREAKASLSALVDAAESGESTVITRHGHPAAMLVPIDQGTRLSAAERPGPADLLLSIPTVLDVERDTTPHRPADL